MCHVNMRHVCVSRVRVACVVYHECMALSDASACKYASCIGLSDANMRHVSRDTSHSYVIYMRDISDVIRIRHTSCMVSWRVVCVPCKYFTCVYIWHMCIYVCVHVYVYKCMCVYICIYIHVSVYTYVFCV